jgi:hypothetical protein
LDTIGNKPHFLNQSNDLGVLKSNQSFSQVSMLVQQTELLNTDLTVEAFYFLGGFGNGIQWLASVSC